MRIVVDNAHEISYLFCRKLGKMSLNLSSAAVVIGALWAKPFRHHLKLMKTMNFEQTTFSNFLATKIIHVAGASHKMSRLSFFENEERHHKKVWP